MIALMGFFAVYAGLMYSEVVGVGVMLFDSTYSEPENLPEEATSWELTWNHEVYKFGVDPAWHGASNELLYVNSLKMKLAVLFGVTHMVLGLFLRFLNAIHFRCWLDFLFECVPMTVFMFCFFGYMDFMIMYKWVHPMDDPPSIINTLIGMGLGMPEKHPLYEDQSEMQSLLMSLTALSVPMILIPKPLILWLRSKNTGKRSQYVGLETVDDDPEIGDVEHGETTGHDEFELGEVVIHQLIETIEYVLGTVSHTASYLRLWALSLAHQQLSLVFLGKVLLANFVLPVPLNGIVIYISFAMFAAVTTGVLLGMDVLECFLHTLRLHWVEFQGKFYKADGVLFQPFSIRLVLEDRGPG